VPGFASALAEAQQGTDEWLQARAGKITASRIKDMMAGGKGVTRDKLKAQLAVERLTGLPVRGSVRSAAMQHGTDCEAEAKADYGFLRGLEVIDAGFVDHPSVSSAGASPDGYVGQDGLIEVKCPETHTHVGYWLDRKVPREYAYQCQWQLACTGRRWVDWVSYDPSLPPRLRLLCIRIERDEGMIALLESEAVKFNFEINELAERLGAF
jgi:putative phage-type endonuclease